MKSTSCSVFASPVILAIIATTSGTSADVTEGGLNNNNNIRGSPASIFQHPDEDPNHHRHHRQLIFDNPDTDDPHHRNLKGNAYRHLRATTSGRELLAPSNTNDVEGAGPTFSDSFVSN